MSPLLKHLSLGIATLSLPFAANAAFINGVVTFYGAIYLDNNANSALASQASLSYVTVGGVAGAFSPGISAGDNPALTSPLVLGSTPATIWTAGGFTFYPNAPIVGGGGPNNTFALGVTGIVDDGPGGYDPTPSIFSLANTSTFGPGVFESITATAGVPEPATCGLIAGLGLLGFAGYRRIQS